MADISIDDLLGVVSQPAPQTKPVAVVAGEDLNTLEQRLANWSQGCRDVFVDLRSVKFCSDDGGMFLTLPDGSAIRRIDFKRDPSNPKDVKIVHAQKQFCRMLGVPHTFFTSNRPMMRESIVTSWQSGLETDDKRSRCIARVREGSNVAMIRALLPERAVPPKACDVLHAVREAFGNSLKLVFAYGDDKDDLVFHARFLFEDRVPVDKVELFMGFDLVFSELGAHPMTVDALVYDPLHAVAYVASYGGEPFFSSKYDGLQPKEIAEMLPGLLARIRAGTAEFKQAVQSAIENGIYSIRQDCVGITRGKGINASMRRAVFHEATQAEGISSKLDLAMHVALVAKDFDSLKGLVLERAAGHYINLCFARSNESEQQEGSADDGENSGTD